MIRRTLENNLPYYTTWNGARWNWKSKMQLSLPLFKSMAAVCRYHFRITIRSERYDQPIGSASARDISFLQQSWSSVSFRAADANVGRLLWDRRCEAEKIADCRRPKISSMGWFADGESRRLRLSGVSHFMAGRRNVWNHLRRRPARDDRMGRRAVLHPQNQTSELTCFIIAFSIKF